MKIFNLGAAVEKRALFVCPKFIQAVRGEKGLRKKGVTQMKQMVKNYTLFILGLFIASLGVAFSTKAGLGTSPVSAIPYSISIMNHTLTFGWWLNVCSVVQIAIQVLLLRSKCKPVEIIIQTVLAFVYGYLTDFSCALISGLTVTTYPVQFLLMALSCFILGIGIWIQFKGGVAMLPGEAMNRAIGMVTGKRYENVKIFFDVLYIVISAVLCFAVLGQLSGVREGSLIAAFAVGNIIKLYQFFFQKITHQQPQKAIQSVQQNVL